jgi:hypothetical protein
VIEEVLYIKPARIFRSDRPYAAISEGMAIQPALRERHQSTKSRLKTDLPRFLRERVMPLVQQHIEATGEEIADAVASRLFDGLLKETLVEFRGTGGVTAMVCGGKGVALGAAGGPITMVIGGLLAAGAAYAATTAGINAARSHTESLPLPALSVRLALTDRKIASARRSLHAQTRKTVLVELNKHRTDISAQLENSVSKEIDALTELHHL